MGGPLRRGGQAPGAVPRAWPSSPGCRWRPRLKKENPGHLRATGALLHPVEAAGIEPASESLPFFDPTCVVRDLLRLPGFHGRNPVSRSWKVSPPRAQAPSSASPHYDGPTPPHGPRAGGPRTVKLLVRQPARAQRCRWLLCLCWAFLRATNMLGTRLELPCPRRNQVAPFGHFNCTHYLLLHPP